MPPRKKAEPQVENEVKIPDTNSFKNFEFLDEEPPLARAHDRDDQFWLDIKNVLEMSPGRWAKVKVYDKPGSASTKASNINKNKTVMFPAEKFEARYVRETNGSILFMRAKPLDAD
jgi:hypothetical protein